MIRSFKGQPNNTQTHFQNWLLPLYSYLPSPLQKLLYLFATWWEKVLIPYLFARIQEQIPMLLCWYSLCFFLWSNNCLCTIIHFVRGAIQGVEKNGLALLGCACTVLFWTLLGLGSDQHGVAKLCSRWAKHGGRHHRGKKVGESWGKNSSKSTQRPKQAGRSLHSWYRGEARMLLVMGLRSDPTIRCALGWMGYCCPEHSDGQGLCFWSLLFFDISWVLLQAWPDTARSLMWWPSVAVPACTEPSEEHQAGMGSAFTLCIAAVAT